MKLPDLLKISKTTHKKQLVPQLRELFGHIFKKKYVEINTKTKTIFGRKIQPLGTGLLNLKWRNVQYLDSSESQIDLKSKRFGRNCTHHCNV